MMQESQTSSSTPSGCRFRPYASAKHHVTKGRYITSNDPRGYIPVYEYPLNGQWIMMDIDDGYILWTGIWKALGNSKADIAKMIESQPNLAPLIRRVRGGYLKIQGTWMPYEVALRLSRRVAWAIREELVPLFGPNFPSTCLSPEQPGFGQVIPSGQVRRRARKSTQNSIMHISPSSGNWNVATPNLGHGAHTTEQHQWPSSDTPYAAARHALPGSFAPSRADPPPSAYHRSMPTQRLGLSVDTRSLYPEMPSSSLSEPIRLPPIQTPGNMSPRTGYALPPISAMEDLRGTVTQDSAAVLRRLRMEDDHYPNVKTASEPPPWDRRHYAPSSPRSSESSARFWPYRRPSPSLPSRSPSTSHGRAYRHAQYEAAGPMVRSDDDSDPSPTPPITPTSDEVRHHYWNDPLRGKLDGAEQPWIVSQRGDDKFSDPEIRFARQKCCSDDGDLIHSHRVW